LTPCCEEENTMHIQQQQYYEHSLIIYASEISNKIAGWGTGLNNFCWQET